jgi:large subunit ribosomal protein L15e
MGLYKHISKLYKQPKKHLKELQRQRLIEWRRSDAVVRIERPTRLDRARNLGYKAKQGYIVVRVRVKRGGKQRPQIKKGRRPKHARRKKVISKSYKWIAEERAVKKYKNCEVLNSYFLIKDGIYNWHEVILADRVQVSKYKNMEWLAKTKGRVFRGLTSAGKKSRGLR